MNFGKPTLLDTIPSILLSLWERSNLMQTVISYNVQVITKNDNFIILMRMQKSICWFLWTFFVDYRLKL